MTAAGAELYAGLDDEVRRLLADPPLTEKKLLELGVTWPSLSGAQASAAAQLRVFVITWDPLEVLAARPDAFATVNVDPDGSELVVYIPVWQLVDEARVQHTTLATALATVAGAAVVTTAATPTGTSEEAGRLLADRAGGAALGPPTIDLVSPGWEEIGLGAITDIVKDAFGPVDLDRSLVELPPLPQRSLTCPACAGRRFGFPADLAEAQARMCPAHDAKADTVTRTRLARANASNPDGWGMIVDASIRLQHPHLPNGLATKLDDIVRGIDVLPEPALAECARLVVEAANWFPSRAADFAIALGAEPELADLLPDWLIGLVLRLGRAGLGDEAALVGEALATVDPGLQSMLDGDIAVALADAGLGDQARAKIADNLARWPDDVWIRIHAGDALLALRDPEGAAAHFHAAADLAGQVGDRDGRSHAADRLRRLERLLRPERQGSKPEPGRRPTTNRHGKAGRPRSQRKRGR